MGMEIVLVAADNKIESFRALLTQAHRQLALEFGFRLWDGSRVPADWPAGALAIGIADEGAVASLLRKPGMITLANLWAAKRLDIIAISSISSPKSPRPACAISGSP